MASGNAGVSFPLDEKGDRSTTKLNQGTFEAAVKTACPSLAVETAAVKNWRFGYVAQLCKQVEIACESPHQALQIAQDGLEFLHTKMVFERDGKDYPLREAMRSFTKDIYYTGVVKGRAPKTVSYLEVPYKGRILTGNELSVQIDSWVRKGVIEMDCGEALMTVAKNHNWCDLSDTTVVLCGAGSAMGPFPLLMAMGANVVALDLPRPAIWKRLIEIAKDSPGTMTFPMSKNESDESKMAEVAGCNLLTETPEIRTWLQNVRRNERMIVGAYAYLDGPMFVRVSMAMDAIIESLVQKRSPKIGIAYLCTPTDAHIITPGAASQAKQEYARSPVWQHLYSFLAGIFCSRRRLIRNTRKPILDKVGNEFHLVDAIMPEQGPNYILAKRLQHWRSILARDQGHLVSTNVAPTTSTASVVSNKLFALGMGGMHNFKPFEIFEAPTSNAVMAALLVNDLRNPLSVANPDRKLANPMELFSENAFHGGAWRCGFKYSSIGLPAGLSYVFSEYILWSYLLMYNIVQALGWSSVLVGCMLTVGDTTKYMRIWSSVGYLVCIFQYMAVLEVVHAILGMVRASPIATAPQVLSRIILCILNNYSTRPQSSYWPMCVLLAWSITEVIRYSFFATSILKIPNYPLKWCRYTFFFLLYPMGVSGELGCMFEALPDIQSYKGTNAFLILMKTATAFGMMPVVTLWILSLGFLYTHMIVQRNNALGKNSYKKNATKLKKMQ